ncbi:MAG: serine hydrolase [Rhodospirillales bacterium]|nr:serine hydrolase [Rhodospirillales bacterium]MDH3791744.1 serine hydrolase [Rhodospirillales bacterium]MDH3911618.1 serine hydrolase [Rhodospirillales bacterium]MDH3918456.1 serine hydrolase [Rhodospirillales bacterium]MDH3970044.1 serine hydrolase [Rhodospirillales bacterium]
MRSAATLWLCLALLWPAQGAAGAQVPAGLDGFDRFVEQVMAEWQVPGLAVAAVRDGEIVLCRAYGFRDPERGLPVTPRTLFAIGSVTKTFTATGLAILADEGRLAWDRPLRDYLPDFALMDPEASRRITPLDLVTHRSGLPRHDVLWYAEAFDRAELLRRIRYLRPTKALGETFQYQNLMFMVAGVLAGRLAGTTWEDFTRRRLLDPLGMTSTRLSLGAFLAAPEIALPYFPGEDGREAIAFRNTDEIAPAGAVYSNIEDMVRYLRFHLDGGRLNGRRLLSPAGAAELRRVRVRLASAAPRKTGTEGYGLGFYVARYRGHRVVRHGGAIDGYLARLSFMPEDGLGLVVLSNLSGGNPVPRLVAYNLYDRLLGLDPLPWAERRRTADRRRAAAKDAAGETAEPDPPPLGALPPPRALAAYAGRYEHPAYGDLRIEARDGALSGRFNDIGFALVPWDGDTWQVPETVWPLREGLKMTFLANGHGEVDRLATPIADGPTYRFNPGDMIFRRAP